MESKEVIARHNFDLQVQQLGNLNSQIPNVDDLKKVNEMTAIFKHKVTGAELNDTIITIQEHFEKYNELTIHLIKEFGTVYSAFNALDKEYIEAIMVSVEGAKIASDQAKKAGEEAAKALKEVQATLETQGLIIEKIKLFKNETEKKISYLKEITDIIAEQEHYSEIDILWDDTRNMMQSITNLEDSYNYQKNEIQKLISKIDIKIKEWDSLKHINDIDEMWDDVNNNKKELDIIQEMYQEQSALQEKENIKIEKIQFIMSIISFILLIGSYVLGIVGILQ